MLTAKVLGGLAGTFVGLALLQNVRHGTHAFDLYLHDTYFVIAPSHFFFLCALVSAIFALAYFVVGRWTTHRPNRSVGLMSTGLLLVSILILFEDFFSTRNLPPAYPELYVALGAFLGFLLALCILAVDLSFAIGWTLFNKVRKRRAFR